MFRRSILKMNGFNAYINLRTTNEDPRIYTNFGVLPNHDGDQNF